jgi:formylglycine-generating enzyme required for sulfatase activity
MSDNKIETIPVTYFAFEPVVGISYEAANIFALWLSEMTRTPEGFHKIFRLPTEEDWEYMAQAGLQNTPYAWGGPYTRNYKGQFLAKYYTSSYLEKNTKIDSVTYQRIDEAKFNEIIKNQNQEFTQEIFDSNWNNANSPLLIGNFPPNNWGLYDMCGNVAEMINIPNKTKGGSWASMAYFIEIRNQENWTGKPSDCVGFRLVQTYIGGENKFKVNTPNAQ